MFFLTLLLGDNLEVTVGWAKAESSNNTCVSATVLDMQVVQNCDTDGQLWLTYAFNTTYYPIIPSAVIQCNQGKGFPWQKTCDWTVN